MAYAVPVAYRLLAEFRPCEQRQGAMRAMSSASVKSSARGFRVSNPAVLGQKAPSHVSADFTPITKSVTTNHKSVKTQIISTCDTRVRRQWPRRSCGRKGKSPKKLRARQGNAMCQITTHACNCKLFFSSWLLAHLPPPGALFSGAMQLRKAATHSWRVGFAGGGLAKSRSPTMRGS